MIPPVVHPRGPRDYGPGELTADRWIHRAGLAAGTVAAALLLGLAWLRLPAAGLAAILLYLFGLLAMLGCSAAYHGTEPSPRRELLRRFDHAAIFLMIAGTYTPFTTQVLGGAWGWSITGLVWAGALAGAALKLACPRRFERLSIAVYLALGWVILVALGPLTERLERADLALLIAGGVVYSLGTGVHLWHRLPYQNALWHGLVLLAAACHYAAILRAVVLA